MNKRELHPNGVNFGGRFRIYPDDRKHDQHWAWLRKKAQAKYRGEDWTLTIDEWFKLWDDSDQWDNRGRHPHASAMFMKDPQLGWHIWNVEICDRTVRLRELVKHRHKNGLPGGGRPRKEK